MPNSLTAFVARSTLNGALTTIPKPDPVHPFSHRLFVLHDPGEGGLAFLFLGFLSSLFWSIVDVDVLFVN